jgi:glycosyltransferase involved in cell wall biosynthesis
MRIAFLWDWPPEDFQLVGWADGLAAALKELEKRGHAIRVFMPGDNNRLVYNRLHRIHITRHMELSIKEYAPDAILHWADMTRPNAGVGLALGIPQAICFAGGNLFGEQVDKFNHIFVESEVYKSKYLEAGYSCSIAFGCNTELFQPIPAQPKLFDCIFPATFAHWKRHGIFAEAVRGLNSLAVGHIQPNDIDSGSWRDTQAKGTLILPHVTADVLHYLYAGSRVCVVTSESAGGSQRTVLEALSMNIPLIICSDSDKFDMVWSRAYECNPDPTEIRGAIEALLDGDRDMDTRQYVIDNWSEYTYASALEEGLAKIT